MSELYKLLLRGVENAKHLALYGLQIHEGCLIEGMFRFPNTHSFVTINRP